MHNWAGTQDFGGYCISKQLRLRGVCAYAQFSKSLCFLHTQSMEVEEGMDQELDSASLDIAA